MPTRHHCKHHRANRSRTQQFAKHQQGLAALASRRDVDRALLGRPAADRRCHDERQWLWRPVHSRFTRFEERTMRACSPFFSVAPSPRTLFRTCWALIQAERNGQCSGVTSRVAAREVRIKHTERVHGEPCLLRSKERPAVRRIRSRQSERDLKLCILTCQQ
jgi:hypothetical protein